MRAEMRLGLLVLALAAPAMALTAAIMRAELPWRLLVAALLHPDPLSLPATIVHDAVAPRVLLAWMAGAGSSAAGVIMQRVLQNPLGSPTTFGLSAGASLAIALALLVAPGLLATDRFPVALAGVTATMILVALLSMRQRFDPVSLAVSGMLLSLLCGAAVSCLYLLRGQALGALAIWGAGSLDGAGWDAAQRLWPRLALGLLGSLAMLGPLHAMSLDDAGARARGVPVVRVRLAALVATAWLVAAVSSAVGAIGFVDFAVVSAVRLCGARSVRQQFFWSLPVGAASLWLADGVAQSAGRVLDAAVPTGSVTGLIGAPMLIVMAHRLRTPLGETGDAWPVVQGRALVPLATLAFALAAALILGLALGRTPEGWHWSRGDDFSLLLPWRGPRVSAAAAAGALLAMAGVLTQRLMENPLASPELLGVGTVASLATVVLLVVDPMAPKHTVYLVSIVACLAAFAVLTAVSRRNLFSPTTFLLAGLGLSTALGTGLSLVVALFPLDGGRILSWLGGSTYFVDGGDAWVVCLLTLCGLASIPLVRRWLDILATGAPTAKSLGLSIGRARLSILCAAAVMVGAATLIVGPFAFIGLVAPQLARLMGLRRAAPLCFAAALIGAFILVVADLLGRNLVFPYQLPAGAVASMIGLVPAVVLARRSRSEL